ncbi:MAG TPA: cytochrome c biogenesis protein CcsA [Thermoanaerobaculia bacterium]|jgi:ABC-type uncharacterized transport system permease subunit|nr:cytochrome c biogenesis protein CcsA [Thermoanaerobaculia bacterium]
MSAALVGVLALLLYGAAEGFSIVSLRKNSDSLARWTTVFLVSGLVVHFVALQIRARRIHSVPYRDLSDSMSFFAWMIALAYVILFFRHRERSTGPFLIPLVLLFLAISLLTRPATLPARKELSGSLFAFHVTMAILGYAALSLSFVLALLYLIQNRQLRQRRTGLLFSRLPALDVLDRMEHTAVAVGFSALAVSATLGMIWAKKNWGTVWDAKLGATLLVLVVYAVALFSAPLGLKGKRTAFVSIVGFSLVLFSYTIVNLFVSKGHVFR